MESPHVAFLNLVDSLKPMSASRSSVDLDRQYASTLPPRSIRVRYRWNPVDMACSHPRLLSEQRAPTSMTVPLDSSFGF